MANDELIADFQRMRADVVQERGACLDKIDRLRAVYENAKETLRRTNDQEQAAVSIDDSKRAETKRLVDHVNGLPNQPQVFLERISKLESELQQTSDQRKSANAETRKRQQQVDLATTNLTLAEAELKKIEKNLAEVDEQLRLLRGH
jgi:chromosome segregation ATPase